MPTARQIARLYTLGRNCGLSNLAVKQELAGRYGVDSSKDLTSYQYEAYTANLERRASHAPNPPPADLTRPGMYASFEHLQTFAHSAVTFGRLGPDALPDDAELLALILNDFRLHRVRDRKVSQKQVDQWTNEIARYPLDVFRYAASEWLARHRQKSERYFLGICQGIARDRAHQVAAHGPTLSPPPSPAQGTLELV